MSRKTVLVTGAAGYIGAHVCLQLMKRGYGVLAYDSLLTGHRAALQRVGRLAGAEVPFVHGDICDLAALRRVFARHAIDAVVNLAGLKTPVESLTEPLMYYHTNLTGALTLARAMAEAGCFTLLFSSSATVYGDAQTFPVGEDQATNPSNPYGRTKLFIEQFLQDMSNADPKWNPLSLRYFNPVGADVSGQIGEDPRGPQGSSEPTSLFAYMAAVAVGTRGELVVFGNDYDTPDGTCIRDYIHVTDLALGHVAALDRLLSGPKPPRKSPPNLTPNSPLDLSADIPPALNLGTGQGHSVTACIKAFETVTGRPFPHRFAGRRRGDVAVSYAAVSLAESVLGWRAERGLISMCEDHLRWQRNNPNGYSA